MPKIFETNMSSKGIFKCSSSRKTKEVTIPYGFTEIVDSAFQNCSSLTSITIPNSVTKIGEYAFSRCSSHTNITIPDSVIKNTNDIFSSNSEITDITILDSVNINWKLFILWMFKIRNN